MKKIAIIFTIIAVALTTASFIYDYAGAKPKNQSWGLHRVGTDQTPEVPQNIQDELTNNGGIWLGDTSQKTMYLTFDCGYEAGYTTKILDTLKTADVKAAFFVTGQFVDENPDLIKRMFDEGHIIGNHTVHHIAMPNSSDEKNTAEIKGLEDKVKAIVGQDFVMSYLRPPKGEYNVQTLKLAQSLGYKTVMWSSAYVDWADNKKGDLEYSFNMITKQFHNGSIILLHNTSQNNSEVLERVINDAKSKGYSFGSLNDIK